MNTAYDVALILEAKNEVGKGKSVYVISQQEYDIFVITRVRGGAEDEC